MTRDRVTPTVDSTRRPWRRLLAVIAAGAVMGAGMLPIGHAAAAAEEWNPESSYTSTDNGDGTYRVPLLNSDVPDVSVERIPAAENDEGRDLYYMISTTMHLSPGAPIMKSYDLVNWEIVNYVFDRANIGDDFSLRNGQTSYGQGQWASSLRYHNGLWYVAFNTNNLGGSYLYTTDDIDDGSWDRISLGRSYHDPSLFFDVDGHALHLLRLGLHQRREVQRRLLDRPRGVPADHPSRRLPERPGGGPVRGRAGDVHRRHLLHRHHHLAVRAGAAGRPLPVR